MCLSLLSGFAVCQQSPVSSSKSSNNASAHNISDVGSIVNGVYRNNYFQFSYELPFGWVDRTSDMREDVESGKSKVLLAIFERPPAASGRTINAAVIIAAESVGSYPGLKSAADYFGPLTELTESKGFKSVNEPYEFPVDGKPVVRRDFTKDIGTLIMHQSSLVMISKRYILSFTLIAGSDEDVTE
ncbi:MAG: hypothetical protein ACRD2S_11480, partial [Terriglobales bacterium]